MTDTTRFTALILFMGALTFIVSWFGGGQGISYLTHQPGWFFPGVCAIFVMGLASLLYGLSFIWGPWMLNQMIRLVVWVKEDLKKQREETEYE